MNEDLKIAQKFKRRSIIAFSLFFVLTLILVPFFSYLFDNYWLLFGIIFSYLGTVFHNHKLMILFYLLTIGIIIHWIINGFNFREELTFYWFSFLFGNIFQTIIKVNENMAKAIIEETTNDITETIRKGSKF
jgi:hypothetical protein